VATIKLNNFNKGIIRNNTQMINESNFENWKRSILALACTHQISGVFYPNYLPNDIDEETLFVENSSLHILF
jgi:hypothetical protein